MKTNAFRQLSPKFKGQIWELVKTTDPSGAPVSHYMFLEEAEFDAVTTGGAAGKMTCYFEHSYGQNWLVLGFQTSDGEEITPGGVWNIDFIAPFLNIWGKVEGYKARLSLKSIDGTSGGQVLG
jgi:hypothetical protein